MLVVMEGRAKAGGVVYEATTVEQIRLKKKYCHLLLLSYYRRG